jgi:hypothetical protein
LNGKAQASDKKVNEPKGPQFKQGRHPTIKHGLRHTKGAKTNGRKIINGYECMQFERKDRIGIEQPAQIAVVPHSGSAAPRRNGKATNSVPNQTKSKKNVSQQK